MSYFTVEHPSNSEIIVNKSRFIADLIPVISEEEALDYLQRIKKKYYDAKHHCFAYCVGDNMDSYKCSDDGEPSGTAGLPILNVIKSNSISNALCVVTRYFGGVLLGTGGLTRAYTDAAVSAVQNSELIQMEKAAVCSLLCSYADWSKIQKLFQSFNVRIVSSEFAENINVKFSVLFNDLECLFQQINDKTLGKVSANIEYENYMPV